MNTILLTNDDGVRRYGLWALYNAVKDLAKVVVIAPESARSSTGMSLTFHKALRIKLVSVRGNKAYAVSGNPADCILLGIHKILSGKKPNLVIAGINEGDNTTIQSIYASGTVAAAVQAAILNIPAIAFSLTLPEGGWRKGEELKRRLDIAAHIAGEVVNYVLHRGLPEDVDYLNVNFPVDVDGDSEIVLTRLARARYDDYVIERRDPSGRPYYWQWGKRKSGCEFAPYTDAYVVFVEKRISLTPMRIDTSTGYDEDNMREMVKELNHYLSLNLKR